MRLRKLLISVLGMAGLGLVPLAAFSSSYVFQASIPGLKPTLSLTVAGSALSFASTTIGSTSSTQSVTLTNTGGGALTLSSPMAAAPFAATSNCPSSLAVGASCSVSVNYTPTAAGNAAGTLTLASSAGTNTVALGGAGIATVVSNGSSRNWADGTYASTCNAYLNPATFYSYSGSTGTGLYRVQPSGGAVQDVYCDMTNDGGGWTLVMRGQGANNVAAWNTTASLNIGEASTTSAPTGTTFKLADTTINQLRNGGVYRLISDGFTSQKRFVAAFTYQHTLVLSAANYNTPPGITYATVSMTGPLVSPSSVLASGGYLGISDDQGNFASYFSTNRSSSQGWSLGNGTANSADFCLGTTSNCNFNMWVR